MSLKVAIKLWRCLNTVALNLQIGGGYGASHRSRVNSATGPTNLL